MKILIISNIHSNYTALKAVISREAPFDFVICAGDLVFGGAQPNEVVSTLSEVDGYFVLGNHDIEMIRFHQSSQFWSEGYQALLEEINMSDVFLTWLEWEHHQLTPESLSFLESLPLSRSVQTLQMNIRLCHGHDWSVRLMPNSTADDFQSVCALYEEPVIISGHTHTQFRQAVGGKVFVNPGTVGGDYRLGHSNACYAVIQEGVLSLKHAPYDVDEFCQHLANVPLPDEYSNKIQQATRYGQPWPGFEFLDYTHLLEFGVY
jgi:putative phosphoesterase